MNSEAPDSVYYDYQKFTEVCPAVWACSRFIKDLQHFWLTSDGELIPV